MDFEITPLNTNYESNNLKPRREFSMGRILKLLIVFGFTLAIVAFALFYFARSPFNIQAVDFRIDGPSEAAAGDELIYKIKYKNNTANELEKIKVSFFYPPEAIVLKGSEVSDVLSERIDVENLKAGEEGEKELHVFLVGNKGNIKTAKAVLTFKPTNVRSDFQKEAIVATTINSVPISLVLVAPPNAVVGQKVTYIFDYRNESGEDVSGARFVFNFPENFSLKSSSPTATSGNNIWDIPVIKKGQGSRINIEGIISGNEGETKKISVVIQKKINDKFISYEKAESSTILSGPLLGINIKINNSRDYISFPGDTLEYSIGFLNNSRQDLAGVTISAKLEGTMFDSSTISTDGFFDGRERAILWNGSNTARLGLLRATDGGELKFKIKLNNSFPSSGIGSKDFFVKIVVSGVTSTIPEGFIDSSEFVAKDELITKISGQPNIVQEGYAKSILGGSGPVPPQVNQKTAYTIYWKISNPGSDIMQANVSAILPAGIEWENKTEIHNAQAQLTFNSITSEVTWNLQVIPSKTGVNLPSIEGFFQISITPSENQKGKAMALLKNIRLSGADSFTKQAISLTVEDISMDQVKDNLGGTVQ